MAKTPKKTTKTQTKSKKTTAPKKRSTTSKGEQTKKKPVKKRDEQIKIDKDHPNIKERNPVNERIKFEILGIISIIIGVFFIVSLHFDSAGKLGLWISNLLKSLFSESAYMIPYIMLSYGVLMLMRKVRLLKYKTIVFLKLIFLGLLIAFSARHYLDITTYDLNMDVIKNFGILGKSLKGGGIIGGTLSYLLLNIIGPVGTYLLAFALLTISVILLTNKSLADFFHTVLSKLFKRNTSKKQSKEDKRKKEASDQAREDLKKSLILDVPPPMINNDAKQIKIIDYIKDESADGQQVDKSVESNLFVEKVDHDDLMPIEVEDDKDAETPSKKKKENIDIPEMKINLNTEVDENYHLPSVKLLNKGKKTGNANERQGLVEKAEILEKTLENFGVKAKVVQVNKGPTVTRFEIQPSQGVKVSSIVRLSDDIALNLEATSIRMEAPIPGKAAVGIEIQNENTSPVTIRDVIDSKEFKDHESKIAFAVGKDISGKAVVTNIASMPHLLIAGATGSGKSVCINSLLASILYKAKPEEVKLLLIDPKVVELNIFNGIPHLLIPVVTDPTKAAASLNWAVTEMTDRYKMFADENVRDLKSYNQKMKDTENDALPEIVIVIDELADLMIASPAQVEDAICRLAQMARAAGMHLIVATQRPSVDVITGVIKANIPSRIAFAVSSQVDSRTILDMAGAEKLLGKGDMLFYPSGVSKPVRIQGALIQDHEIEGVINFVKEQKKETNYSEDIIETIESTSPTAILANVDELLKEAIETVVNAEQASVSMLQRKYRVGYNRAARMIDEMEERGIVGPFEGSKPRRVLITKEELEELDF